ncbi:MAG: hypothetical protein HQL53_09770 [Magnetococcales bacterium]|nr:hypothetical protein [Magnetococcales bacterium]
MLMTLGLIVVAGVLAATAARIMGVEMLAGREVVAGARAFYVAESGLEVGRYHLAHAVCDPDAIPQTVQGDVSTGESYVLTLAHLGQSRFLVTSQGSAAESVRTVREEVNCINSSPYDAAIIGCQGLRFNGNVEIDSYNATTGAMNLGNGNIKTLNANALLELIGNVEVYGDASTTGPTSPVDLNGIVRVYGDIHATDAITFGGLSGVDGGVALSYQASTTTVDDCDPLDVAGLVNTNRPAGSPASFSLSGNNDVVWATPSVHHYSEFKLQGNSSLTLHGPGEHVVFVDSGGLFKTHGNAQLNLVGGATLTVYLTGDLSLRGNAIVNTGAPANLRIYASGNGAFDVGGNFGFSGVLYAPFGTVDLVGNHQYRGSVRGWTIVNSGNGDFDYDESLKDLGSGSRGQIIPIRWEEVYVGA